MPLNKIKRKHNYILYAIFSSLSLAYIWFGNDASQQSQFAVLSFLVITIGGLLVQKDNIKKENFLYVLILPAHLAIGSILSMMYFPNLGILVKVSGIFIITAILYAISLVNNVFLVVLVRQGMIPLYRAAVTWLLILLVITAIPFYAGVYKLALPPHLQFLAVAVSTFMFTMYTLWVIGFDNETKKPEIWEYIYLGIFNVFLVGVGGFSASFFPTEPFLRALYISTFLMFGLGYIQAHLKNNINKRLVVEYISIIAIFLAILVIFKP